MIQIHLMSNMYIEYMRAGPRSLAKALSWSPAGRKRCLEKPLPIAAAPAATAPGASTVSTRAMPTRVDEAGLCVSWPVCFGICALTVHR